MHPAPKLLASAAFRSHMGYTPRMQTNILGVRRKTPPQLHQSATYPKSYPEFPEAPPIGGVVDLTRTEEPLVRSELWLKGRRSRRGRGQAPLRLGDWILHEDPAGRSGLPVPFLSHICQLL